MLDIDVVCNEPPVLAPDLEILSFDSWLLIISLSFMRVMCLRERKVRHGD